MIGTTYNFDYTGTVLEITLPVGKYQLECWGALGGTSYGSSSAIGSKGGYSSGILTLSDPTTLYVFVGGQGSNGSTTSLVNGGWNGGGGSVGKCSTSGNMSNGTVYPACGGGATDISTITSTMNYSNGRTSRSSESLLARCIVAGGGAGGSYNIVNTTNTQTSYTEVYDNSWSIPKTSGYHTFTFSYNAAGGDYYLLLHIDGFIADEDLIKDVEINNGSETMLYSPTNLYFNTGFSASGTCTVTVGVFYAEAEEAYGIALYATLSKKEYYSNTSTSNSKSNQLLHGGGISGNGQYPGTLTSAGNNGSFGYGANQTDTGRYLSGAGGGGWYGGGAGSGGLNYSGGGSGFVNTSDNASYRPSGYTGLQLDSGSTISGDTSHPSVEGGIEIGHSGNGYARITVLESDLADKPESDSISPSQPFGFRRRLMSCVDVSPNYELLTEMFTSTSSTSITIPQKAVFMDIFLVGGGGGGGAWNTWGDTLGSPGLGGECFCKRRIPLRNITSISIKCGTGGNCATSRTNLIRSATDGGTTTLTTNIESYSAKGGIGGYNGLTQSTVTPYTFPTGDTSYMPVFIFQCIDQLGYDNRVMTKHGYEGSYMKGLEIYDTYHWVNVKGVYSDEESVNLETQLSNTTYPNFVELYRYGIPAFYEDGNYTFAAQGPYPWNTRHATTYGPQGSAVYNSSENVAAYNACGYGGGGYGGRYRLGLWYGGNGTQGIAIIRWYLKR